jgi:hypothetical protein
MMARYVRLLLAALLLALPISAQASPSAQGRFLHLSDVHFDPLADPSLVRALIAAPIEQWEAIFATSTLTGFPAPHKDSNYPLFKSMLKAAGAERYDYVLFTGDFFPHDFYAEFTADGGMPSEYPGFAIKTALFMDAMMRDAFHGAPVIAALGNNDSLCGDYHLQSGSSLLAAMARDLPVIANNPRARADYSTLGAYIVPHPTVAKRDVIVIDDVYWVAEENRTWSTNPSLCQPDNPANGTTLTAWLTSTLAAERKAGRTATLMMHVPPGINNYAASQLSCPGGGAPLLLGVPENGALVSLLTGYADVVTEIYAGHTHMDDFRVVTGPGGKPLTPIKIGPSVSPIFGNGPSFTVFDYNRANGAATDYAVHSIVPDPAGPMASSWKTEYRFSIAYALPRYGPRNLMTLAGKIRADSTVRTMFGSFYTGQRGSNPMLGSGWMAYACAETALLPGDFSPCTCPAPTGS